jgi:voltage-gated potassium channel
MRRRLELWLLREFWSLWQYLQETLYLLQQPLRVMWAFLSAPQMRGLLILIVAVILFSTAGYVVLQGWSAFDALYMTFITIATIGYGETRPLDNTGRAFTILVIMLSITVLAYGLSSAIEYVTGGQLLKHISEGDRNRMLKGMQGHFIIAGFGRVGQEVARALKHEEVPLVVVENDPANLERAQEQGFLAVVGNATEDEVLTQARIQAARAIICATGSDATNVYIVLTARGLNNELFIISRASDDNSEAKLLRAGADRVISPYILSGRRMAHLAVRPYVVNFLDVTGSSGEIEKTLEEIIVEEGSIIENRTIGAVALTKRSGALILALYRATGELLTSPTPDTLLEAGTRMIVLGTRDALDVTEALSRNFQHFSREEI